MAANPSVPHSTPHKYKPTAAERFSATQDDYLTRREKARLEMGGYFIQMAPGRFLDEFMPCAPAPCPIADFSKVPDQKKEVDMYQPFVSSIQLDLDLSLSLMNRSTPSMPPTFALV